MSGRSSPRAGRLGSARVGPLNAGYLAAVQRIDAPQVSCAKVVFIPVVCLKYFLACTLLCDMIHSCSFQTIILRIVGTAMSYVGLNAAHNRSLSGYILPLSPLVFCNLKVVHICSDSYFLFSDNFLKRNHTS